MPARLCVWRATSPALIRHWLDNGAYLEGSGRLITPGDVLVLVRKRGAFVNAVNRALKEAGLPVAGADRLALLDHIAVMDLLSLGDVMLLPQDDLSLASVLKSPIFGLGEERLFDLSYEAGGRKRSLWEALRARAEGDNPADADFKAIFEQLSRWQGQIDFQPPFDFFAQILGPGGKRQAFIERLGPEADEVMDELLSRALDFEKNQTPNLQAFLSAMRQGGAEIKRDMGAAEGQIRVMTVHGSKGLEAPHRLSGRWHGQTGKRQPPSASCLASARRGRPGADGLEGANRPAARARDDQPVDARCPRRGGISAASLCGHDTRRGSALSVWLYRGARCGRELLV